MSHEFESGFFTREPAWHQLGTVLEEAPTVEDGIVAAGLDWRVIERPIFVGKSFEDLETSDHNLVENGDDLLDADEFKAIVRETDLEVLGVVKRTWTPLQNANAFTFFNPILAEGDSELEAAGSLKGGKIIWVLAKIKNGDNQVLVDDPVDNYLLLCNSHDGSMAVWIQFTAIRVVCWNTLSMALDLGKRGKERTVKIHHRGNIEAALREVQNAIDISRRSFHFTMDVYRRMSKHKFSLSGFKEYVQKVFIDPVVLEDEPDKMPQCYEDLERLWREGAGTHIPGVKDTLWGGYNAVTEWMTHERGKTGDTRLRSNWFGQSNRDGEKALEVAREMVGADESFT